jgi:hypothetical protein
VTSGDISINLWGISVIELVKIQFRHDFSFWFGYYLTYVSTLLFLSSIPSI